ncbi:hypothetical protein [Parasedimentitalea psychrophila]|uniref:Uncharacterized protein n=1 Tax=Parasedimentitalea psychrophila TaxID=2997337 RepID=A0A9Y2L0R3_9RHOB|nr:hypothetical protein [Parasedimentitalea psychrophila]WIY26576.1 hypothetical protein QPJ95_06570 [Parasedimentitalea psychrophila]
MGNTENKPAAKPGAVTAVVLRLQGLFRWPKLTADQAETLATIKFPCC